MSYLFYLTNSSSEESATGTFAHQIGNSAKVRKVTRYNNFTGTTCYSLVIAEYPMTEGEARRAAIDSRYAKIFNVLVIDYGTDFELMNEAATLWN